MYVHKIFHVLYRQNKVGNILSEEKKYDKQWRFRFTYRSRECRVTCWPALRNKRLKAQVATRTVVAADHCTDRRYQQEAVTEPSNIPSWRLSGFKRQPIQNRDALSVNVFRSVYSHTIPKTHGLSTHHWRTSEDVTGRTFQRNGATISKTCKLVSDLMYIDSYNVG